MTSRQDIADAINAAAVPFGKGALKAFAQRPTVLAPGQVWPQYALERDQASQQFERTWQVWLTLPASEPASVTWFDDSWPLLVAALKSAIYVTKFDPVIISAGENPLFGMIISGESE